LARDRAGRTLVVPREQDRPQPKLAQLGDGPPARVLERVVQHDRTARTPVPRDDDGGPARLLALAHRGEHGLGDLDAFLGEPRRAADLDAACKLEARVRPADDAAYPDSRARDEVAHFERTDDDAVGPDARGIRI